jgi:hypothetical protein
LWALPAAARCPWGRRIRAEIEGKSGTILKEAASLSLSLELSPVFGRRMAPWAKNPRNPWVVGWVGLGRHAPVGQGDLGFID